MNIEFASIVKAFRKTGAPWAVTGSWAIKLHAEKAGLQPHRPPRDFDFAIHGSDFEVFVQALQGLGYLFDSNVPLLRGKRLPDRVTMKKGPFEVDLLKAGGRLAPSLNGRVTYKNVPLVSVSNMMRQKKNLLENIRNTKALANLNFLDVLHTWNIPVKKSPPRFPLMERIRGNVIPKRLF